MSPRAPLSPDLSELREILLGLLPTLEAKPDWYASIYFERKTGQTATADLKKTSIADRASAGVVLRIYDGETLFEQATDALSPSELRAQAQALVARASKAASIANRPYNAPTWTERLKAPLEQEILSQIPKNPTARTPVHFGVRVEKDPFARTTAEHLEHLKSLIARAQKRALTKGLSADELSYALARMGMHREEALFIDRESNLSQTLYRMSLTFVLMSGPHQVYSRPGGLGGMEAIELEDQELDELVDDLMGLRNAERLTAGKYRVLFSPGLSGVLAHEAFGHAQEADTCARGRSKAWPLHLSGEKVGNGLATILNNPAIYENGATPVAAWGSYFFDEEGWFAQEQVLLDQGTLKAPMTNLTSALRLGVPRTANGKRESWASGVYTRQTNTYFSAGKETLQELLAKIDDGFLATHAAGGMEDPKGMGIQVGISYLKEVKKGKLTGRIFRGPAGGSIQMTGYTPDVLNSIIGKTKIEDDSSSPDRARHPLNDVGGCGKYHKEFVQAGCGGPYVLLDQVVLG